MTETVPQHEAGSTAQGSHGDSNTHGHEPVATDSETDSHAQAPLAGRDIACEPSAEPSLTRKQRTDKGKGKGQILPW